MKSISIFSVLFVLFVLMACSNESKNDEVIRVIEKKGLANDTIEKLPQERESSQKIILTQAGNLQYERAKVSGKITTSELRLLAPQLLDSIAIIFSIDNREAYLEIRREKEALKNQLQLLQENVNLKLKDDFDSFNELLDVNSLLPGMNPKRFSEQFIHWFEKQDFYKMYFEIQRMEEAMSDYFYMNETPIYIHQLNKKIGSQVAKGEVLYSYLKISKKIPYETKVSFSQEEVLYIEVNGEQIDFSMDGNRLKIKLPFKKYAGTNEVEVLVVLKPIIS